MKSIQKKSGVSDESFHGLYRPTIYAVADLVQLCPATAVLHQQVADEYLLPRLLALATNALARTQDILLPPDATPEEGRATRPRYRFAIFAAALLRPLGIAMAGWKIVLYNQKQTVIEQWTPGYERHPETRYMSFEPSAILVHDSKASLLLAHRVISHQAMYWVRSHPTTWADFMAVFSDSPSGPIHRVLIAGYPPSLESPESVIPGNGYQALREYPIPGEPLAAGKHSPIAGIPMNDTGSETSESRNEPIPPPKEDAGTEMTIPPKDHNSPDRPKPPEGPLEERFLEWVVDRVNQGRLVVNDPDGALHRLAEGLFVLPRLLDVFIDEVKGVTREALEMSLTTISLENPHGGADGLWEVYGIGLGATAGWIIPEGRAGFKQDPGIARTLYLA